MPEKFWEMAQGMFDAVDGNLSYKATFVAPGVFEQTHHLCEIQNALIYYLEYPDEMHDLVKYLTEYELELAELTCARLHPDALFSGIDKYNIEPHPGRRFRQCPGEDRRQALICLSSTWCLPPFPFSGIEYTTGVVNAQTLMV